MRGGFLNLSLDTRRVDLVRAAVEGTARNLAWLLPWVESFKGERAQELVFGGGAARSAGWAQVVADVCGLPVRTLADPSSANARAVALQALGRAGVLEADHGSALVVTDGSFEPSGTAHALHAATQPTYEAAVAALRPIFHDLNPR